MLIGINGFYALSIRSLSFILLRFGLEKNLRLLSEHVDRMSAESSKHANYYKGLIKQQQLRQQHQYKKEQEVNHSVFMVIDMHSNGFIGV